MRVALPQPQWSFNLSSSFLACADPPHKSSVVMLPCLIVSNGFPLQVEGDPALSWLAKPCPSDTHLCIHLSLSVTLQGCTLCVTPTPATGPLRSPCPVLGYSHRPTLPILSVSVLTPSPRPSLVIPSCNILFGSSLQQPQLPCSLIPQHPFLGRQQQASHVSCAVSPHSLLQRGSEMPC